MIGNDIVDIATSRIESNWNRKGFLNKIFTIEEQFQIQNSENQEIMVWNLWSRKEAAYKILNRMTQIRIFNPKQLECTYLELKDKFIFGKVISQNNTFLTKTSITPDFIYTEAVYKNEDFNKIRQIERPKNIIKHAGIPSYYDFNESKIKLLSITHHGKFEKIITLIDSESRFQF